MQVRRIERIKNWMRNIGTDQRGATANVADEYPDNRIVAAIARHPRRPRREEGVGVLRSFDGEVCRAAGGGVDPQLNDTRWACLLRIEHRLAGAADEQVIGAVSGAKEGAGRTGSCKIEAAEIFAVWAEYVERSGLSELQLRDRRHERTVGCRIRAAGRSRNHASGHVIAVHQVLIALFAAEGNEVRSAGAGRTQVWQDDDTAAGEVDIAVFHLAVIPRRICAHQAQGRTGAPYQDRLPPVTWNIG